MKTVEIIKGTYGHRPGPGKSTKPIYKGTTVDLPDAEADRLVNLKVARYVIPAPEVETPPAGVATPPADTGGGESGSNIPDGENGGDGHEDDEDGGVLEIIDGHFTIESLMTLERKDMDALAADLGVEAAAIKKCKNKSELAGLIAAVEVEADEEGAGSGEQPPDLTPEAPVT